MSPDSSKREKPTKPIKDKVIKFKTIPRSKKEQKSAEKEEEKNKIDTKPIVATEPSKASPPSSTQTQTQAQPSLHQPSAPLYQTSTLSVPLLQFGSTPTANQQPQSQPSSSSTNPDGTTIGGRKFSTAPKKILPRAQREALERKARETEMNGKVSSATQDVSSTTIQTIPNGTDQPPPTQTLPPYPTAVVS